MDTVCLWFGSRFERLHPALQALHIDGGSLSGQINVRFGRGMAGRFGHKLAQRLGVPQVPGAHEFSVQIRHADDGLHWDRCFDQKTTMRSLFKPVGQWPQGHWIEETGPMRMQLTVDVVDGGWYWRAQKFWLGPLRLPMFLFPDSHAYKKFEDGRYRFHVEFSLPVIGHILSYGGDLDIAPNPAQGQACK